ncbi:MAG: CPBP family intramembrane glutamic endopeptidase [Sphingomicrobium sp.]
MDQAIEGGADTRPLWKKIVDFPLVAMIIAVALFIAALALALVVSKLLPPMDKTLTTVIKAAIALGLVLFTYKFAIRRLGEVPRDDLPVPGAAKGLGVGLLFGLVLFSVVVGVAALFDVYNIVGPGGTSELLTATVVMAIMPGFMEELLFRGILFRYIEEFGGSWTALLVTSALFGAGHIMNPNATAFSSFAIAVEAGILLGGAYMLTRSLWMPMGLHAAWNFTQGEIFDVPVSGIDQHGLVTAKMSGPELLSGGTFGLEASLIALVIATAAGIWLVVRAVQQGQLMQPWWVRRRLASQEAVGVDVDRDTNLGAPVEPA